MKLRRCTKCKQSKPTTDFYARKDHKDGLQSACKACHDATSLRWSRANRPRNYARKLFRDFGLTPAQYDALRAAQGDACAICRQPLASLAVSGGHGGKRGVYLDHDHATNSPRGLLCLRCNTFLGLANDDPARLLAAVAYLAHPPAARLAAVGGTPPLPATSLPPA